MLRLTIFTLLLALTSSAFAATKTYTASVTKTRVQNDNFGGCMAALAPSPSTIAGVACKAVWATMSCSGDFNSPAEGQQKLAAAQLALVTGNKIAVLIDDSKKHNGYCFIRRIDNLSN
jgi:hypothetical protein